MASLPVPFTGTTLLTGPSNAGKTRSTARAMREWVDDHGPANVVVLDFAPEVERDGRLLGGRLSRFVTVPRGVWYGVLDAHAPRAEGESDAAVWRLATANGDNAHRLLAAAPANPSVVFVNDATIPFQSGEHAPNVLIEYCDRAEGAVLNAFESDELGATHPVSRHERNALDTLRAWASRTVELG